MSVPFVDLHAQHREVADEVGAGFARVMQETAFVGGKDVSGFERDYETFSGVPHCVGVGNGTDALEFAFRAAGIGAGDEVLVPANTFVATAEAVVRAGAEPVFVDVDDDNLLMDPGSVEEAVGPRTRAIAPVHLYGQMAPMEQLTAIADNAGLLVIEDAAQAQGARRHGSSAGSIGIAAGTSFYPGKNLGAYGDGGAVLTTSADVARTARLLGAHGSETRYVHERLGFNSRMDTLQAVALRAKLTRLARWNENRRAAAHRYGAMLEGLQDVRLPGVLAGNEHVWHLYVIRVPRRSEVMSRLQEKGIGVGIHYPVPVHLQPAFRASRRVDCPVTEAAADLLLSLPMHPHLTDQQQERIAETLWSTLG